jgi:hypothetical protein
MQLWLRGLLLVCFSAALAVSPAERLPYNRSSTSEKLATKLVVDSFAPSFAPSLEVKEAADFLITPALLVRDALTNGIGSYPTE